MNEFIIKTALAYFINRVSAEIKFLTDAGEDVSFLPEYVSEAESALSEYNRGCEIWQWR